MNQGVRPGDADHRLGVDSKGADERVAKPNRGGSVERKAGRITEMNECAASCFVIFDQVGGGFKMPRVGDPA